MIASPSGSAWVRLLAQRRAVDRYLLRFAGDSFLGSIGLGCVLEMFIGFIIFAQLRTPKFVSDNSNRLALLCKRNIVRLMLTG